MIYYLSLMDSKLDTRVLKEFVPAYAARCTNDTWEYFYTEKLEDAMERVHKIDKHDLMIWDTMVKDAGNQLIELRRTNPSAFLLLFASSRTNPMMYVRAGVAPDGLLLKPYDEDGLKKVLNECFDLISIKLSKTRGQMLSVYTGHAQKYLQLELIDYLEARDKRVYIRIKDKEYGIYGTLDEYMSKLPENFLRCHRSYVINMLHIDRMVLSENYIEMKNGDTVPVSRTYKKEIKEYGAENE